MQYAANFEIKAEFSVIADDLVLRIQHPRGLYRARIQNIKRADYTTPFLLSLHLYFDAPSLDEAKDVSDDLLTACLNIITFVTGARLERHRVRQIVEVVAGSAEMMSALIWGGAVEYMDPQPYLDAEIASSIEKLLEFDTPPAIRRALGWYRIGVNETTRDDQFMCFWFAVEILGEYQKSSEKVTDKCPRCRSALYCESCNTHPVHKPYAKQAIRSVLKAADESCDDATIDRLDKTRNSLMHGATLKEIEDSLPDPHEQIVDVLGRLVWRALINQFPSEIFKDRLRFGYPNTYVSYTAHSIANVKTVVPTNADGDLELNRLGVKVDMVPFGPPQSARPTIISMSEPQYELLRRLTAEAGDHQEMCRRITQQIEAIDGRIHAMVLSTDMAVIKAAIECGKTGPWQDLFREIVGRAA
ncbi:methylamine utilization protein MauJ [Candidatus Accumulibacter sp. ACC007]|uniref:methylamine utilization protein MauJ n=1 Tax=Candidatus Accumulibacter sp. ACC007 TaxID=2823333 RepID=UPI0025BDF9CB|nr:methylamine utilization protein MauJ [Candidatus Accumulibacter sp. ACC007]